jgi:hypothetical protein
MAVPAGPLSARAAILKVTPAPAAGGLPVPVPVPVPLGRQWPLAKPPAKLLAVGPAGGKPEVKEKHTLPRKQCQTEPLTGSSSTWHIGQLPST